MQAETVPSWAVVRLDAPRTVLKPACFAARLSRLRVGCELPPVVPSWITADNPDLDHSLHGYDTLRIDR